MMKKSILSLLIIALASFSVAARNINISGKVVLNGGDRKPAGGVIVSTLDANGKEVRLAQTDDDGEFLVTADDEGVLIFTNDQVIKRTVVDINEQFVINVSVQPEMNALDVVTVSAKRSKKKGNFLDNAVVEMEGNWAKIKGHVVPLPKWLTTENRYIVQPAFYNSTRDTLTYLTPRVVDTWRYETTQDRMYDWDLAKDTLVSAAHYKKANLSQKDKNYIIIRDSLYVNNPDDVIFSVYIQQVENYNKIVWCDSQQVAVGTTNPFRFLKINMKPMVVTDAFTYFNDRPEQRNTTGEMNLLFSVGKANLDIELGDNSKELNALVAEINKINNDNDAKLKEISIFGYSSPEGSYETNTKLANARMKSALDFIKQSVNIKKTVKLNSEAAVTPWSEVVIALRADSLFEEANQIQDILDRYTGFDSQFHAIARLPFYRPLLTETYLPRMRRVTYAINYDFQRVLTDEEIREQYKVDPSRLTKAQIYRYYSSLEGPEREEVLKQTIKSHPDHWVAATDLAKMMIDKEENPFDLLHKVVTENKKRPLSTRYNYGIAAMMSKQYSLADSVFADIEDSPDTHMAKLYSDLMNGYEVDADEIAKDSPFNRVLILLKKRDNQLAYALAKRLGNSAKEDYVKAVAANRVATDDEEAYDAADDALMYLESAIRKDHKLYEVALIDQDVVEVLQQLERNVNIEEILSAPEETIESENAPKKNDENPDKSENVSDKNNSDESGEETNTMTVQ